MAQMVKNLPAMQETWVRPLGGEDPLEEGMATHTLLPREPHGQRSLAGCSPQRGTQLKRLRAAAAELISTLVLVSGTQESDSIIYMCVCVCILFQIFFHGRVL